jgi:hypothetical protein
MRRNGVELLTMINPSEPTEEIETKGGWTMDRLKNLLVVSAIGGVGYHLYRNRMRNAATGEEAQRASRNYLFFGIGTALLLYLVYGDRLKEMSPSKRMRLNSDEEDVEWTETGRRGSKNWTASHRGKRIGDVVQEPWKPGFEYSLAYGLRGKESSLEVAKEALLDAYFRELADEEDCDFFNDFDENPQRNSHRGDIEWVRDVGSKLPRWFGYIGDEMVAEITVYEHEDGFRFRLIDEWSYIPAESFNEAVDGVIAELHMEEIEERWLGDENKLSRYFVMLPDEGVSYPKRGSEYYPEGYPLNKALDFARIGSQKGGSREVRRDGLSGKRVRTYKKGRRTWPRTKGQAKNLLPAEVPTKLRAS